MHHIATDKIDEHFWPSSDAFLDISSVAQLSDGRARCTAVALCDAYGHPARSFFQGQQAHFFYEFEVLDEIGVPSGGLEFHDATGRVIHGKNAFQYGLSVPCLVQSGTRLRYHQIINLEVAPGEYWFTVGLASTDEASYRGYREGSLTHEQFSQLIDEHCRVIDVGKFTVRFNPEGKLLHHGVANLPGECRITVVKGTALEVLPAHRSIDIDAPTIFHITHWKAGSQWIHKILAQCVPDKIVPPQLDETQFLHWPLQPGKVYPTVYVTKQQFDSVRLPSNFRRFVIIRDLRDTLVSAYFSIKVSHPVLEPRLANWRAVLHSLSLEDGMIYLMDEWLPGCARIQVSWLEAGERLIRYEDLLEHDLEILEPLLLEQCQLPVSRERFREVVLANRFERLTGGRPRGQEDISAHERKGIAGDWRNYFTDRVKQAFKTRYGGLLVATGYEKDLNW
ncbi:MAG: Wzt carbohydrate-binding domain-containing protein [Anaerolineae bacterium]|uniref:Wzt carbohydrate-binding domain-containing protein n=1 Tax=Thermogutta sp. TaxID=1962930 RepID=UPI0032201DEE